MSELRISILMPAKPAAKKIAHESQADFSQAFAALKKILVPYVGKNMRVVHDTSSAPQPLEPWLHGFTCCGIQAPLPRNRWN